MANQRYTLSRALLDHNETYRSQITAWEIGWGYRGTTAVTLAHNTSRRDYLAVSAENGDHLTIRGNLVEQAGQLLVAKDDDHLTIQGNRVEQAGSGIWLEGALTQPRILHNTVTGSLGVAIIVNPPAGEAPVTGLVVRGNTVTDNGASGFTTNAVANLTGASIVANTFSRNGRFGIQLTVGKPREPGPGQRHRRQRPVRHPALARNPGQPAGPQPHARQRTGRRCRRDRGHDRRRHGAGQPLGTQHVHSRRPGRRNLLSQSSGAGAEVEDCHRGHVGPWQGSSSRRPLNASARP